MAPITLVAPTQQQRLANPRAYALLKRVECEGGLDSEALLAEAAIYGNQELAEAAASKSRLSQQRKVSTLQTAAVCPAILYCHNHQQQHSSSVMQAETGVLPVG
jgi:hypothetical protein